MKNLLDKKLKKTDYIVIVLIGILILIIAVPSGSKISTSQKYDSNSNTSDEKRLMDVLENMEGVGKTNVMITTTGEQDGVFTDKKEKVEGVVVVAQGAGNATIDKNILDVVMALFDVEVHKIKIVKMSL